MAKAGIRRRLKISRLRSWGFDSPYPYEKERGVAQSGSALAWGASGRRFKSSHPDQFGEEKMKKRIHVNQHKIRRNHKSGDREPVLSVKTYKSNDYCHEAVIDGPCKVIYSPDKPLPCGARVWIETEHEVICVVK